MSDFHWDEFSFQINPKLSDVEPNQFKVIEVDGNEILNKNQFFNFLASALPLPEYFGKNLDALFDCLVDEEVLPKNGIQIKIIHAKSFLKEEETEEVADVLDCIADAAESWLEETQNTKIEIWLDAEIEALDFSMYDAYIHENNNL